MSRKPTFFTLQQKIFIIKTYYKANEDLKEVTDALMSKHSILCSDDANMRSLRQLILMFESSGNITKMVCYDPKPPTVSFVEEVTIDIEDDDRVDNDQQDESEKRQAVQDIEYSVEVSATDPANNVVVEEVTVTASSAPRATGPRPAKTADPKKPLSRKRKLFQCPTCDKLLANETFYKEHISLHKAQEWRAKERYICEYCAKESTTKSHHQMHMLIHSDAKPYECGECPARFSRKQGLRRHIMTHTGEKPYVCDHCGASFAAYMSHQLHVRRHTGERPHVCRHCGAKFIGLPSLNIHLKTHVGEYMFQCGICKNRFKSDKTMTEHVQRKHGEEFATQQIVYTMAEDSDERE